MVQGVGFRACLADEARLRGISGWVRNRRDGSVEALVHGEADAVDALVAWSRRGPRAARVDRVTVDDGAHALADLPAHFEQRPTA